MINGYNKVSQLFNQALNVINHDFERY